MDTDGFSPMATPKRNSFIENNEQINGVTASSRLDALSSITDRSVLRQLLSRSLQAEDEMRQLEVLQRARNPTLLSKASSLTSSDEMLDDIRRNYTLRNQDYQLQQQIEEERRHLDELLTRSKALSGESRMNDLNKLHNNAALRMQHDQVQQNLQDLLGSSALGGLGGLGVQDRGNRSTSVHQNASPLSSNLLSLLKQQDNLGASLQVPSGVPNNNNGGDLLARLQMLNHSDHEQDTSLTNTLLLWQSSKGSTFN